MTSSKTLNRSQHNLGHSGFQPQRCSSSLVVLGALGVLGLTLPAVVSAQAIAPNTLPQLRGVVSGRAVVNSPVPGATRPQLTIDQATQRAIISWDRFNIGSHAEVLFRHQMGSTSSTLNRIFDAAPSVIEGRLSSIGPNGTPGGQVILINQNGILFNRGAQVNTQSLVASTLNITNERFLSGALTTGGLTAAAFEGGYDADGNPLPTRPDGSRTGNIVIGGGAPTAPAATLEANAGGSIMVFAPSIDNQGGIIKAPDGQVILAAGSKAYLALNSDVTDTTLRGLVVEVEAAPDGPGVNLTSLIRNSGEISADRGNVTLAALAVNQNGRVSAKTALQNNGSVYLKAHTLNKQQSGTVTLGQGSVTEVMPDTADKATIPESASYDTRRGAIEVDAGIIDSRGTLRAGGGRIALRASDASDPSRARVYLDRGSETNVAGVWADVDYASNFVTFRVTSNELKNSPDQKNGLLRGAQVTVDLRQGSSILDLSGYVASRARTVAEKASHGGELNITSTGSVVQRDGATIDASGGGYRYGAGSASTSRLLGADGKVYDIATAPQALRYVAQLDSYKKEHTRWGQTQIFTNPLGGLRVSEPGYLQGASGGAVTLSSSAGMVLDGNLNGGVLVGKHQMTRAPRGASLTIGRESTDAPQRVGNVTFVREASDSLGAAFHATSDLTSTQRAGFQLAAAAVFGPSQTTAQGLQERGFSNVELNSSRRISVPADVRIEGTAGAALTLRAPTIDVAGDVYMPGGKIDLPETLVPVSGPPATSVHVASGAHLSTAGAWINASRPDGSYVGGALPSARLAADGSTISTTAGGSMVLAGQSVVLDSGAVLDVGGGGAIDRSGRITGGAGGSLTLINGQSADSSPDWLRADLRGFALANGGQLSISTPRVVVAPEGTVGTLPANTTRIDNSLFSEHGFSSVEIKTTDGVDITAGTVLRPQQQNLLIDPVLARSLPTGAAMSDIARVSSLPDSSRSPVHVSFSATAIPGGSSNGVITMHETAQIIADPKARVSMTATNGLVIDGRIVSPGGTVALTLNGSVETPAPALSLGETAHISTAGTFVQKPNERGLTQGTVISGGSVTIDARNTGVDLKAGSVVDVSGHHQMVDVVGNGPAALVRSVAVDGPAGTVLVKSQGAALLDGDLLGRSPSATSAGGSFALELVAPNSTVVLPETRRIVVTPTGTAVTPQGGFVEAQVDVDKLAASGFDKLRLLSENTIEFRGGPSLEFARGIRLDAPLLDVADGGQVAIKGSTVSVGQSLGPRVSASDGVVIQPMAISPVLATRAGTGTLTIEGGTVDIFGNLTVNGVSHTTVEATNDIRLIGRPVREVDPNTNAEGPVRQTGSLTTLGNLELKAAQVYPSTRTAFSINIKDTVSNTLAPNGSVVVSSNGNTPGGVYSAAGKLRIEADTIVQDGVLKAPLGEIDLKAGQLLELRPGSVTSVSTDGLTIPFGTTLAGVTWVYNDGATPVTAVTNISNDGKTIKLSGATVDVQPSATVDLRGGGDVLAIEFVPGSGGDNDTTLKDNTYAIIPRAQLSSKVYDTDIAALKDLGFGFGSAKQDTAIYDSVVIGSGGAVPAGEYVLLPARYALLPDAYLVQLQTGSAFSNMQPGQTAQLQNGATVVAGFRSAYGTSVRESHSVGVLVRPGSAVRGESDFTLSRSQFFATAAERDRVSAPPLPQDAGRLAIERATALRLEGNFLSDAGASGTGAAGKTALFDISGPRIAVVDAVGSTAVDGSYLQLSGASLSGLGGSVLLGGTRSNTAEGTRITTEATDVVVANTAAGSVQTPELLLAARDSIDVRAGASLAATGTTVGGVPSALLAEESGALVRLSNAGQTTVNRGTSVDSSRGQVTIASGATLSADRAVLIDATRTLQSQGSVRAGGQNGAGGAISLASAVVSLGEVAGLPGIDTGLVLSNADLAGFGALDALTLKSYGGIDLYGSTQLGSASLKELTLDTAALRGNPAAAPGASPVSTLQAGAITLINSGAATTPGATAPSAGTLAMNADRITFGAGDKTISGWSSVASNANGVIVGQGTGSVAVASDWVLSAQRVHGAAGSNQTWSARDGAADYKQMTITAAATPTTVAADTALGARLALEGQRIDVSTTVQALSGRITLAARGTEAGDDVNILAGGVLNAGGASKNFNGALAVADGGVVTLNAARDTGRVNLAAGSSVDVSAVSGGHAGSVQVNAGEFSVAEAGALRGSAAAGQRSGSAQIEVNQLDNFSALNDVLNAGGFAQARSLRVRTGNIDVSSGDVVRARDVTLAADAGQINVAGRVGSGSTNRGAAIGLYGGSGVTLSAGSLINAGGTGSNADGGDVRVATQGGALNFDANATIDVRKGQHGQTGSVTLTLPRGSDNALGAHRLEGTVLSQRLGSDTAATVAVEAQRVYTVGSAGATTTVTTPAIAGYAADHQAFISGTDAAAVVGQLRGDGGATASAVLRGATELRTAGDLSINQAWNLTSGPWLQGGEAGTLSLRAAGNLTISNAVGSVDNNIVAGATWNLRTVAGADLAAADPLSTLSLDRVATGKGDLVLSGANAKLRTGTGRIDIAAARDFNINHVQGVVYTAGRIGAADTETNGNNRWGVDGGDITVRAGRDVLGPVSPAGDLWITDWLRRPRTSQTTYNNTLQPTNWWAYRPNFQQGLGTLGGGNIDVEASRDVSNLAVMLPTTGRTYADTAGARQVDVQGGGDLRLLAGNDITGGAYLIARGEGRIDAAGDVGKTRAIQLYMMGASSGDVPRQASFDVDAGGSLRLQSINNPTSLALLAVPGATGPSFGASGFVPTFLTYSDNSVASLQAEGGDLSIGTVIRRPARTLGTFTIVAAQTDSLAAVLPASLAAVAFNGSIVNLDSPSQVAQLAVTYPSALAQVKLLADGSIEKLRLSGSDLDPAAAPTPSNPPNVLLPPAQGIDGLALLATGAQPRILERNVDSEFVFDIQALTGSITGGGNAALNLPAKSRVRAGLDIVGTSLTLQNLETSDVSEVRADQGDVQFGGEKGLEIRGPGRLLLQAGRDVNLGDATVVIGGVYSGALLATGNAANPQLPDESARITVVAGVTGNVDLTKMDGAYAEIIALNKASAQIIDFYRLLGTETNAATVLGAASVAALAQSDPAYARFVALDQSAPRAFAAYKEVLRTNSLPLGPTPDSAAAASLYRLLNTEADVAKLTAAGSLAALAAAPGGAAYGAYVDLEQRYPRLFADYVQRRGEGATPTGVTPMVFSNALAEVVAEVAPRQHVKSGNIFSYQTSIQTYGGSDIDLWAPGGDVVVGLTTPPGSTTVGVLTNAGGAIRSVLSGDFNINSGKVLTAQGGDILLLSTQGSIDAGRGAKTSLSTPPPVRTPIFQDIDGEQVQVGVRVTIPSSAAGSGIQTLTSDPDGLGPLPTPRAGDVFLFAPAGAIDAGEAGIRSSGNLLLNAQTVLNTVNITAGGSSQGVPVAVTGSLASALATSGGATDSGAKAAQDAAKNAAEAARAATATGVQKPSILTVEVLGFGEKNCKEQEKDCFAK